MKDKDQLPDIHRRKKPNRLGGLMYRQTSLKHLQRSFNTHFIT